MVKRQTIFTFLGMVLLVFLTGGLHGQALQLTRENSGLVDNFVSKITLFNGLPVACTDSGLSIVQESAIETWRRGSPGFPDSAIRCGAVFQGKLWVGTDGKGLARFDGSEWKQFTMLNSGLIDNYVTTLEVWGPKLYIGTREGICAFNGFLWERLFLPENKPMFVSALAMDGEQLWIGTREGVFQIRDGKSATPLALTVFPPRVVAIRVSGGVTFVAFETALAILAPNKSPLILSGGQIPSGRLYDVLAVDGGILCGSGDGLFFVDSQGRRERILLGDAHRIPPLPVTALGRGNGFLWLGFDGGGLVRLPENLKREPILAPEPEITAGSPPRATSEGTDIQITQVRNFLPGASQAATPQPRTPLTTGSGSGQRSSPAPVRTFLGTTGASSPSSNPSGQPKPVSTFLSSIGAQPSPATAGPTPPGRTPTKTSGPVRTFLSGVSGGSSASAVPDSWVPISLPKGSTPPEISRAAPISSEVPRSSASANQPARTFLGGAGNPVTSSGGPVGWVPVGGASSGRSGASPQPSSPIVAPTSVAGPTPTFLGSVATTAPVPGFAAHIQPLITQKCLNCHTRGSGSFFPLNDGARLITYFRANGTARFEAAAGPGRGMAGLIRPEELNLIRDWVSQGAQP